MNHSALPPRSPYGAHTIISRADGQGQEEVERNIVTSGGGGGSISSSILSKIATYW